MAGMGSGTQGQAGQAGVGQAGQAGQAGSLPDASIDMPDASNDDEWQLLIEGEWTIGASTEGYYCARQTVNEDLYVHAFEAISPPGTHHTLLTMGDPNAADGLTPCGAGDNRTLSVFGSGVGTDRFTMPDGVALKIPAGTQLLLNLHLFNTSTNPLSGTSGTRVLVMAESEVEHLAEGVLAGTTQLQIPGGETTMHTGYCTMRTDATIFAVAPHMHQIGIHEKVVAERGAGDVTLFDAPYDFSEQSYLGIEPVQLSAGDRVRVECTHRNETNKPVGFGDSSLAEMCFAGLYRYPAAGGYFICTN
jgi:hypothetical protein